MLVLLAALSFAFEATEIAGPTLDALDAPDAPEALRNAEEEPGYPSAVGLGAFNFTACSGSLITPKIVLSAAHCGGDMSPDTIVSLGSAYFGPTPAEAEVVVRFEEWIPHPDYVPLGTTMPQTLPQNDVGVVVLDDEVDIEPVPFRITPLTATELGTSLTSVGFGSVDGDGNGSGVKRSGVLTIDAYVEQFIESHSNTNPNQAQICSGDSGGPMYFEHPDGRLEQWGVHSYGDLNCTQYSGNTRTDLVADFILDEVERVHGSRDLCLINGRYDDGVCDDWCDADPDCLDGGEEARGGCACNSAAPWSGSWLALGLIPVLIGRQRRR